MEISREDRLRFAKHLGRAQGWLLLENFAAARRALRHIPRVCRRRPEVGLIRAAIAMAGGDWKRAEPLLRRLLRQDAGDPGHWVKLAFAVRRAKSLAEAEPILREASRRFPEVAVVWFNLACYAAQQGRLDEVPALLREAIRLEPGFERAARADPDLMPYWTAAGPGGTTGE